MFKLKGIAAVATAIAMLLPISAQASDKSYKLVLAAESGDRNSVNGKAVASWASMIKEKSKGRMKVNVFYQGELGGQQEMFDQLVKGNIHMMLTWPQTSYDKRIVVNYIPYLVLDWDDAIKSYGQDGWLRKLMDPVYKDIGLKYFGPFPEGFGGIGTKGRYATSFEKAKGIKVRSQPIFPLPQTVQAMGFEAVPIDWAEVYTSIQTGVVDGDSSNVIYWDYEYFRDQLNYFVQSSHNFASYSLLMNGATWEKMDAEDRGIIESAAQAVIEQQFKNAKAEDDKWVAAAQKAGIKYIVPNAQEKGAWVERVRKTVWPQIEKELSPEIMTQVRANASTPK
ncbi:TRAP transporter substrate-binding protein DctP [Aromatoleum evansii]|uniref:TRAP transporter substrate-binding protein DctP n=1 Tax=Aromatoleum evansii TaxID=59406 RepID=A0ABZ1AIF3_AROEV|nr:TRAP transporter substrate-binding protein DctP [Aromatoleum evansii]